MSHDVQREVWRMLLWKVKSASAVRAHKRFDDLVTLQQFRGVKGGWGWGGGESTESMSGVAYRW
jgi:hypothetical protein